MKRSPASTWSLVFLKLNKINQQKRRKKRSWANWPIIPKLNLNFSRIWGRFPNPSFGDPGRLVAIISFPKHGNFCSKKQPVSILCIKRYHCFFLQEFPNLNIKHPKTFGGEPQFLRTFLNQISNFRGENDKCCCRKITS